MIPMLFSEVRVTAVADTPVLLLREEQGVRHLAVWITAAGGNAILSALEDAEDEHAGDESGVLHVWSALDERARGRRRQHRRRGDANGQRDGGGTADD